MIQNSVTGLGPGAVVKDILHDIKTKPIISFSEEKELQTSGPACYELIVCSRVSTQRKTTTQRAIDYVTMGSGPSAAMDESLVSSSSSPVSNLVMNHRDLGISRREYEKFGAFFYVGTTTVDKAAYTAAKTAEARIKYARLEQDNPEKYRDRVRRATLEARQEARKFNDDH